MYFLVGTIIGLALLELRDAYMRYKNKPKIEEMDKRMNELLYGTCELRSQYETCTADTLRRNALFDTRDMR